MRRPILVVADCHIGNTGPFPGPTIAGLNSRCRQALGALAQVSQVAKRRGARDAISLGDFFDSARPEPAVIRAAQIALQRSGLRWHMLVGNHEQRTKREPGDNSLAPLAPVAESIADGAPRIVPLAELGVSFVVGSTSEEILGAIGSNPDRGPWYAFHAGIWDERHPPYMRETSAVSFEAIRELGIHALAGDWHEHLVFGEGAEKRALRLGRIGNGHAVQVGSLLPRGFGELGVERGVALLLVGEESFEVLPAPGPRFLRIELDELGAVVELDEVRSWGVYLEIEASTPEERDRAASALAAAEKAWPTRILGWRVRSIARAEGEVARVRRGETAEEAIAAFVRTSPEITAPRDEVLAHALGRFRVKR